jgi:5-formyltetrahydrofolate cyclo-ligase
MNEEKTKLRQKFHQQRKSLLDLEYQNLSQQVCQQLSMSDFLDRVTMIAAFYPNLKQKEVNILPMLLDWQKQGKRVLVPRWEKTLLFYDLNLQGLEISSQGWAQPQGTIPVDIKEIEACMVPGLVFDLQGNRIGYGKGYYDQFLSQLPKKTLKIGICFEFQITSQLIPEEHDVHVDRVITDRGEKKFRPDK